MGQQQLLLLVLSVVLVGLAVVVGIQAFGENQKKTNLDAMTTEAVRFSTAIQTWKRTPAAFGGGEAATDFTDVSFATLGITPTTGSGRNATYTTLNASYRIKPIEVTGPIALLARQQFGVTVTGSAVAVVGINTRTGNSVLVGLFMQDVQQPILFSQHPYIQTVYDQA